MTTEVGLPRRARHRAALMRGAWLALLLVASAAAGEAPLRVAVISDLNGSYGTVGHADTVRDAVARIVELRPDLVISTGDMVAGQRPALLPDEQLAAMWRAFHATVTEPLAAAGIPLAVTPGNHDASAYPRFSAERRRYAKEWAHRRHGLDPVDFEDFPFNYAFRAGDVLFISLDVTVTGSLPAATRSWLGRLLERERKANRRLVVFSHVPIWPFAQGRQEEAMHDAELHAMLAGAGVDLYLSGHHHVFYPGILDGVAYISQACLGSGTRRLASPGSPRAERGFTLLEFDADRVRAAALTAPGFTASLDWEDLPASLRAGGIELVRADLAAGPLAPLRRPADAGRIAHAEVSDD